MTQDKMVLDYMEKHGSITPQDAIRELGILRLAARVYELRNTGVPIIKNMETGKNRFGEDTRYARYTLS